MAEIKSTQLEQWLPVVGYENFYEVSDRGRVKQVARRTNTFVGKILEPSHDQHGYLIVSLSVGGCYSTKTVHRLVLLAHIGPCPAGMLCRHLDGSADNNHIDNLKWGTRRENEADKVLHGTNTLGERHPLVKLTERSVREIRAIRKHLGWTLKTIGELYGVSLSNVHRIDKRKSWVHI